MRSTPAFLSCVAVCASSAAAVAQDSVSKLHAVPGDSIDPRATSEQVNDYIVDQAILRGSWGTVFGIAPIVKTSQERLTTPAFFNAVANAQYLSRDLKSGVSFARPSYSEWTAQGFGVNNDPLRNDPGTPVSSAGLTGFQFGVAMAEFSTGTTAPDGSNASLGNVTGGLVNRTSARPSRLYVSRVVAAVNSDVDGCEYAAFGIGSVDADGNVHFRADGNATSTGGGCPIANIPGAGGGNNHNWAFRVRLPARNAAALNLISGVGASDAAATDTLLTDVVPTTSAPNALPQSIGTRPVFIAPNFNKEYVYESSAGATTNTLGHYATGVVDHRGLFGVHAGGVSWLGASSVAVVAALGKATLGGSDGVPYINLFGVDANGNVLGTRALQLPPTLAIPGVITDPDQPTWSNTNVPGPSEYDHYHSQMAFGGGSGQIAVGVDQQGNLVVAAVVYYGLTFTTPPALAAHLTERNNYVAVARVDPTGTTTTWSVAAWTQETTAPAFSDGKSIYQNGTTVIGRLTGASFGPAMSAPMFDSVGNVWLLSGIQLNNPTPTNTTGLLRGVYDPATFSYKLELVAKVGDVIAGRNSATNYQIRFMEIVDSNSVSSGTAFSGNCAPYAHLGQSTVGLLPSASATLGGIVVHASIIYDVNNDGLYQRSTGTTPVVGSPDEDYEVLLYLSSASDVNGNNVPDDAEVLGVTFCFGDNIDPNVTTDCPCLNFGSAGRGCANSVNANGAFLTATGTANPDTAVLQGSGMPATVSCIYLQGDGLLATGIVFGDGIRCADGTLLRLRTKANVGGASSFPDSTDTVSLSVRGGVVPGSGATRYYQTYYRNAAALFCPPETFNATNGFRITW